MNYVNFIRKHSTFDRPRCRRERDSKLLGKPGPHQATSPPSALSQERTLALPFSPSCSLHRQTWPCENVNDINSEPNGDLRSRERTELSALPRARRPLLYRRNLFGPPLRRTLAVRWPKGCQRCESRQRSLLHHSTRNLTFVGFSHHPPASPRELPPAPRIQAVDFFS